MLRFKEYLKEALNLAQKRKVGIDRYPNPSENAMKLSANLIPSGQNNVELPLTHNNKSDVVAHLEKHGYTNHNYANGTTTDKRGREVSIGSVLKSPKTEAPEHVIKGFENDNRALNITPDTHHILLSRDPEKYAECSSNKDWESCKTLTSSGQYTRYGGGIAARSIKPELESGSHVAYLMPHGEHNVEKAHARMLLHRYDTHDEHGNIQHSALMPEKKVYSSGGGIHTDFQNSLNDYVRKNAPMKEGKIYHKSKDVYDDDNDPIRFNTSPKSVAKILSDEKTQHIEKVKAIQSVKLPHATMSSLINDASVTQRSIGLIARHQKLSDTNFDKLLPDHLENISKSKKLSKSQVKKIANYKVKPSGFDNIDANRLEQLNTAHADMIHNHGDSLGEHDIHSILDANAEHEKSLQKAGVVVNRIYSPLTSLIAFKHKLTPEHIAKIRNSISDSAPDFTGEDHGEFLARLHLGITHKDSTKDIHDKITHALNQPPAAYGSTTENAKLFALKHPLATPEHFNSVLSVPTRDRSSAHPNMVSIVLKHKNLTKDNVNTAIDNGYLRDVAGYTHSANILATKPNLSDEHITHLIGSQSRTPDTMRILIHHQHLNDSHINSIIGSGSVDTHSALLDNPNLSSNHIKRIADTTHNSDVNAKIIQHPNTNIETLHEVSRSAGSVQNIKAILKHPLMNDGTSEHYRGEIIKNLSAYVPNDHDLHHKILNHPAITSKAITNLSGGNPTNLRHKTQQELLQHRMTPDNIKDEIRMSHDAG